MGECQFRTLEEYREYMRANAKRWYQKIAKRKKPIKKSIIENA